MALFNAERAAAFMRQCGLDALVATSPVNVTYFSDYYCWLDPLTKAYMLSPGSSSERALQTFAIFPMEGEPALVLPALFAPNARGLWVVDVYGYGDPELDDGVGERERPFPTAVDALVAALRDRDLEQATIGLEREGLTPSGKEAIVERLPRAQIKDSCNLIRLLRCVKTEDERGRLATAAQIAEDAAIASLTDACSGQPIPEIVDRFRLSLAERGADFDHFAFGVDGVGIAMESAHALPPGEVLYVDFGCVYRRCFSDSGFTFALGELPRALAAKYEALRETLAAGTGALRPGARASSVWSAMRAELDSRGGVVSAPQGHGLGLEVREYPIIGPDNGLRISDGCVDQPSDLPLEAGMVVNLEAACFAPGVGSLQIEQSFVVWPQGAVPLAQQAREAPIRPRR